MHKHFYESQIVQARKRKGPRSGRHSFDKGGTREGQVRTTRTGSQGAIFHCGRCSRAPDQNLHTYTNTHRDTINLKNRTASYSTSKQWTYLRIAEICYPGQTSYSKSIGESNKQERNMILGRRKRALGGVVLNRSPLERGKSSGR